MSFSIGIDLGGTNIKAALVDTAQARTVATLSKPTRDGEFDGDIPRFALTVREIVHELEAQAGQKLRVGLSAPGLANPDGHCIDWMPGRMHGLEKFPWSAFLERDCRVLNDAHAALLGEVWAGAAKDTQDAFMLTLGTGVGGAIWSGGRLLKGKIGRAGIGVDNVDIPAASAQGVVVMDWGRGGSTAAALGPDIPPRDAAEAEAAWFARHFEWTVGPDGREQLRARPVAGPRPMPAPRPWPHPWTGWSPTTSSSPSAPT